MEPITHFFTGACIGRAGFNRRTAYATVVAVLAAEVADIDMLWEFGGPVDVLKHHRGITHTFLALPVLAGAVVGAAWLVHRWRLVRQERVGAAAHSPDIKRSGAEESSSGAQDPARAFKIAAARRQPVHWGWLYTTALVAASSHLVLDWMNNYGIRPLYPFKQNWHAGSFMSIAEPVLWGIFLVALGMPWLLGLADREIGIRKQAFRGQGWAIFALIAMAAVCCFRWEEHSQAFSMVTGSDVTKAPIERVAVEPYPVNPFHWHAVIETEDYFQTAEVNTWNSDAVDAIESDPLTDVIYKPTVTPAVEAARQTYLGQVYLGWTSWVLVRDVGQQPEAALKPPVLPPGRTWTTVTFNNLLFDYSFVPWYSSEHAPLSGWVYIVDGREEAGEGMGGRVQK